MKTHLPYFQKHHERVSNRRELVHSYRQKADAKRNASEKFADWLTAKFGTVTFLAINAVWFTVWVVWNTGMFGLEPFDPFPFGLLTMLVSLVAIFLAIIVLISQNRAAKVAEVREEIDLQINSITEGEVTKIIELLLRLMKKNDIKVEEDEELSAMLKPMSNEDLAKALEDQLGN